MAAPVARRAELMKQYQTKEGDTGSPQVQVALLTEEINLLSEHMQTHKKDLSSRRGLLAMVARRRKLLDYLKSKNEAGYKELIERLNIRR